jgi:hypothetical protein
MLEKRFKRLLSVRKPRLKKRPSRDSPYTYPPLYLGPPELHYADIRPRHSALLALEGWYETDIIIPPKYEEMYAEYLASGSKLKVTRWALWKKKLSDSEASELGNNMATVKFKFSCRHHDLLRLSETNHYKSCMNGIWNGQQQLQYLSDPDMAVVYIMDKAGKFSWRALVRLVYEESYYKSKLGLADEMGKGFAIVMYRVYGNGPSEAIFRTLDKRIHVYQAYDLRHGDDALKEGTEIKTSPTTHNNKFLSRPIWTDHYGVGWNADRKIKIEVLRRGEVLHFARQDPRYVGFGGMLDWLQGVHP